MGTPLRVLLGGVSDDDERLLVRQLGSAGFDVTHRRVDTPDGMQEALDRNIWDIVISDYSMPQFSGTAPPSLLRCTAALVRHLDVIGACIWTFSESAQELELQAGSGLSPALSDAYTTVSLDDPLIGNIVRQRRAVHLSSVADLAIPDAAWV